jgi:NADPH:quinone reductase-like Zn-dependent oxidoreductase
MMILQEMHGVYLTKHGGYDSLVYRRDIPVPEIKPDEVLIKVAAAGVNNTDINTRVGWYSKSVTQGTGEGREGFLEVDDESASWSGDALQFPRIQGADCCGEIVRVGEKVDSSRLGERVLVRTMQAETRNDRNVICQTLGSERDGAFAQYMAAPGVHSLKVECDWSDVELASIPCAYSTAEAMLHRADLGAETVLITGASGGVGSAAIQLAKRRGARVIALASRQQFQDVRALGADEVLEREQSIVQALGFEFVDVVVDLVGGQNWPALLEVLKRGGRYVNSGAIAGPMVELDLRTLYLKDLSLLGSTYQSDQIFENLISYIEAGEIRPVVANTFPLKEIVQAQEQFLTKNFTGKLVLVPEH